MSTELASSVSYGVSSRLGHLDSLRGLACLAVTWFHMTNTYTDLSWARGSGYWGWLGVEVFFVISGFIIPYALYRGNYAGVQDFGRFLKKRLLRLEPPYIASMLIIILLSWVVMRVPGFHGSQPDYNAWRLFSHLGYLTGIAGQEWLNVVYWTLGIEFQFYLLVGLFFTLMMWASSLQFLIGAVIMAALPYIVPNSSWVVSYLGLFVAGLACFRYRIGQDGRNQHIFFLLIISIVLAGSMSRSVALTVFFSAAAISFCEKLSSVGLDYLGKISFSLYLLHVPIGGKVVNLLSRFGSGQLWELMASLLGLVASVLAAIIFFHFVERPAMKWSSRIRYS